MWRAQLEGDPESLEILRKNFKNYIVLEDDNYYLKCPQFETEEENLLSFAEEVLENMINILDFNLEEKCIANLQGTFENIRNHGKDVIIAIPTARANAKGSSPSITIDGKTLDPDIVNKDLEKSLKCIMKNQNIQKALYFNKKPTWPNLYKIYELIRHDMGGKHQGKNRIINEGWATANEIDLFTCTANPVQGAGLDARHAVENEIHSRCQKILSKQDPMKLPNAKSLIRGLLKQWIDYKCN